MNDNNNIGSSLFVDVVTQEAHLNTICLILDNSSWRLFAEQLQFSALEIEDIQRRCSNTSPTREVLKLWRDKQSATMHNFIQAVKNIHQYTLSRKIMEMFPQYESIIVSSSNDTGSELTDNLLEARNNGKTNASRNIIKNLEISFSSQNDITFIGVPFKIFVHKDNLRHAEIHFSGPPNSVYEGGVFRLDYFMGEAYPIAPPTVKFLTRIVHPNIVFETGNICVDVLDECWSPAFGRISSIILRAILSLMTDPNPDNPVEIETSTLCKTNPQQYEKLVRLATRTYAFPGVKHDPTKSGVDNVTYQRKYALNNCNSLLMDGEVKDKMLSFIDHLVEANDFAEFNKVLIQIVRSPVSTSSLVSNFKQRLGL